MPSTQNTQAVTDLKDKISRSKSIIIADYAGLDSSAQVNLRAKVSEAGGQFTVAKNRLFKIAVSDTLKGDNTQLEETLNGPNAFLFSYDDAVSALKEIFKFAADNQALEIKLGILDGRILTHDEAKALSQLPSKKELIAQLISRINGPTYGLVNVLNGPIRGLVTVLKAHQEKLTN